MIPVPSLWAATAPAAAATPALEESIKADVAIVGAGYTVGGIWPDGFLPLINTKSRNLILTSVVLISGISGAAVKVGAVELKGMALGTIVSILISLMFYVLDKFELANDGGAD